MEGQSRAVAPSYLGWSIFNTLCCCLPLGIAAIVYSCRVGVVLWSLTPATFGKRLELHTCSLRLFPSFKVQNANAVGDNTVATDASRTAKMLNIIALVCGIILLIIFIALKATQGWAWFLPLPASRCDGIPTKLLLPHTSPPPQPGSLHRNRHPWVFFLFFCLRVCVKHTFYTFYIKARPIGSLLNACFVVCFLCVFWVAVHILPLC